MISTSEAKKISVMSWDVIIFRSDFPVTKMDDLPDDFKGPAMGTSEEIRIKLSSSFPGTDWSDPAWGIFEGDSFSIEFNIGHELVTTDLMLHVRGNGEPVTPIAKMCLTHGWSAIDTSTGELLNLKKPSTKGWLSFIAFRDRH
jgi:hypothetical protein